MRASLYSQSLCEPAGCKQPRATIRRLAAQNQVLTSGRRTGSPSHGFRTTDVWAGAARRSPLVSA